MKLVEVDPNTGTVLRQIVRPDGATPMRGPVQRGTILLPVSDFRHRRYVDGKLEDWERPASRPREPQVPVPPKKPGE